MDGHSRRKGAWAIIFLLVSFYVIMVVSDITAVSKGEVSVKTPYGMYQKAVISTADKESLSETTDVPTTTLHHFQFISPLSGEHLVIDVPNRLFEKDFIARDTVRAYYYEDQEWKEASIHVQQWNKVTTVDITPVLQTTYYVSGEKDSAPKTRRITEKQMLYLFVGITGILLIIAHAKPPSIRIRRKKKENKKVKQAEEYIRKAIMKGQEDERIKRDLLSVGWEEKHVDEALRNVRYF